MLGYLLLWAVLVAAAGWSLEVARDQAIGLGVHAGVVFVRGVLPAVLATGIACIAWRRSRGAEPGVPVTFALAVLVALVVTLLLLASPVVPGPLLAVERATDGVATVLLLGAAGAAADLLARRLLRKQLG